MNAKRTFGILALAAVMAALTAAAKDKPGRSQEKHEGRSEENGDNRMHELRRETKEPWVRTNVVFSVHDRQVVQKFADGHTRIGADGRKPKPLPPGLAKKIARGGSMPYGWKKKCVKGEIMPVTVYQQCQPLPREVAVQLAPVPEGIVTVAIGGKVVRLLSATREILDVFDLIPR